MLGINAPPHLVKQRMTGVKSPCITIENRIINLLVYPGGFLGEAIQLIESIISLNEIANITRSHKVQYAIQIYSLAGGRISSTSSLMFNVDTQHIAETDEVPAGLLIIAHCPFPVMNPSRIISSWLRGMCAHADSIIALGSGVLLLAQSGLLNYRRVTTLASTAMQLAESYPHVHVISGVSLQVDGNLITTNESVNLNEIATLLVGDSSVVQSNNWAFSLHTSPEIAAPSVVVNFLKHNSIAHRIVTWWLGHIDEVLSMERSAQFLSMSERNFRRHFTLEVGYPPYLILLLIRLELSRQSLIESDLPVDKIARRCGMHDGQQLARIFKKYITVSPQKYRVKAREGSCQSVKHSLYFEFFDGINRPLWFAELCLLASSCPDHEK
ncbi:MAG: helix-turn-helix domain-containing protein [Ewingella sp.]